MVFAAICGLSIAISAQNFSFNSVSNRIITPNGDGKNDSFTVSFFNPQFSSVDGKIFDLNGHLVSGMTDVSCPSSSPIGLQCMTWNATSNGHIVSGGVYVYLIVSGSEVYDGTVVVIR